MGDWQEGYDEGLWGMDGEPYGSDSPCWNDDWEHELRSEGCKTVKEWNAIDRIVKKGEKGHYLPCARLRVFSKGQTIEGKFSGTHETNGNGKLHFKTFSEAVSWAKNNPSKIIKRSTTSEGYIEK